LSGKKPISIVAHEKAVRSAGSHSALPPNSPMSGQHDVGGDQEPKRVITNERNIDKYGNDGEPRDNERNDMYTENVEHRRCPYAREICA
jgi:hypothetical protein